MTGRRAGCILAVALAMLAVGCVSAHAAPSAVINGVRLEPRADLSAKAWRKSDDTYDRDYVYPLSRKVRLLACGSSVDASRPNAGVPALSWRFEPLEGQRGAAEFTAAAVPGNCTAETAVKALGRWRITLTATNPARESAQAVTEVTFRDIIVAAIGDSFASGEGNKVKGPDDLEGWIDPQCHRSYNAWPAFVARALENDTTAVTFLSVACSGADVPQVVNHSYEGLKEGSRLPPQLKVLRNVIGDPTQPGTRPVTVLLGATGINTISLSDSLIACVLDSGVDLTLRGFDPVFDCQADLSGPLSRLPQLYDGLELAISANLRVAQTHLLGYPSRIMTNAFDNYPKKISGRFCFHNPACVADALLCGVFANTTVADKQWMTDTAETINRSLTRAGTRNGWTVTQTRDVFRRKGYCAPDGVTWFRSLNGSFRLQGDVYGTAHPLLKGQKAAAEAMLPRINPAAVAPAPDQFLVNVRKRKLTLAKADTRLEQPRRVGPIRFHVYGATHVSCATPDVRPSSAQGGATAGGAATRCSSFLVRTAGKTINLRASATVKKFVETKPPNPDEPHAGHSKQIELRVERRHLRAANWNADVEPPPGLPFRPRVRRLVSGSTHGEFGRLELEYTIIKPFAAAPG